MKWILSLLFVCLFNVQPSAFAGTSNSLMDISADGELLVCSNRDAGTLSVVDLRTDRKLREIELGRHPEGVTFIGKSHHVAVAIYGEDRIDFVDVEAGKKTGSLDVFDEPYAVISNADGARLWATLEYPGEIVEIDPQSKKITRTVQAGKFLRGLAVTQDDQLLATEYYTGIVKGVDLKSFSLTKEWKGSPEDSLARQITTHPEWRRLTCRINAHWSQFLTVRDRSSPILEL